MLLLHRALAFADRKQARISEIYASLGIECRDRPQGFSQLSGTRSGGGSHLKGQQLDPSGSFEKPGQTEEKDKDGDTNAESGGPLLAADPPQERPH